MSKFTDSSTTTSSSSCKEIIDVYASNFISEIKNISELLEAYPYIGMDTEFPGNVYPLQEYTPDFYYKSLKLNVDSLKLIQLGITLSDEKGNLPKGTHTWQFNLKFDLQRDKISPDSYALLHSSGVNFDKMKKEGIPHHIFAEYIMISGLVLNEDIHWVSFHGSSDFAYLLKLLLNSNLPDTEEEFTQKLEIYFPNHYDLKVIVQQLNEKLNGGLNRIAQNLRIQRIGEVHQAGSDAYVTIGIFNKINKSRNEFIEKDIIDASRNVLFGIGLGADDAETIQYTKFANIPNIFNNNQRNILFPFHNMPSSNYQMTVGGPFFYENPMLSLSQDNNNCSNMKQQHHKSNSTRKHHEKQLN